MMRIISICIICIFTVSSFAQNNINFSTLQKSEGIKPEKKNTIKDGIHIGEHGYYMLKITNHKTSFDIEKGNYQMLHFDKDLKLIQTKDLDIPLKGNDNKIQLITLTEKALLVFILQKNRKEKEKQVVVQSFDTVTLEKKGEPKVVYQSSYKGIAKNQGKFEMILSSDKSKILIHEMNPISNSEGELIGKVLDTNLETLWKHQVTGKEINNKYLPVHFATVRNSGEAYFILGKRKSDPQILKFDASGHEEIYFTEKLFTKRILSIQISFDYQQNLVLLGFYSDDDSRNIAGIIKAIDTDGKNNLKATYAPFTKELIQLNTKKGSKSKRMPKMQDYRVRKILQKSNGNWVFIGEENFFKETKNSNSNSTSGYIKKWYHKNVIVAEISSDGKMIWSKKIPKSGRNGEVNRDVNFFTHLINDDLLLFYRDHSENMNYAGYGDIKFGGGKQGQISMAHFSNEGVLNITALFSKAKDNIWNFNPRKVSDISANELLFFFLEDKEYKLVHIKAGN